jgi:hypothetical protein
MTISHKAGLWREYAAGLLQRGCIALAQSDAQGACQDLGESVSRYRRMQYIGELSWALSAYALAQLTLGNLNDAQACLLEGVNLARYLHLALSTCLPAAVVLLVEKGELEAALSAYAAARKYPVVANSRWADKIIGQRINTATEALPTEIVKAAQDYGTRLEAHQAIVWLQAKLSSI